MSNPTPKDLWKTSFERSGITRFGYQRFKKPMTLAFYKQWLNQGFHGEMDYLARHLKEKEDPSQLLRQVRGSFSLAIDYKPHPQPTELPRLKIASYAKGLDYHHWFQKKTNDISTSLKEFYPDEEFLGFTDSKPVLEREQGYLSGLGWVGKNTCLISQKHGSFFLLAEIYTTLDLEDEVPQVLHPDRCGTCTRCIEACPTGALIAPKTLDSRKCISYWTIESRSIPDKAMREQIGDHYFGCDICQDVCPWNEKVFGKSAEYQTDSEDLIEILKASNTQIKRRFEGTALMRTNPTGHRRNAIIVAANLRKRECLPYIEKFLNHKTLGELAQWAINTLTKEQVSDGEAERSSR